MGNMFDQAALPVFSWIPHSIFVTLQYCNPKVGRTCIQSPCSPRRLLSLRFSLRNSVPDLERWGLRYPCLNAAGTPAGGFENPPRSTFLPFACSLSTPTLPVLFQLGSTNFLSTLHVRNRNSQPSESVTREASLTVAVMPCGVWLG